MKSLVPIFVIIALAAPVMGEVVHMNDGTTIEGTLQRTNDGWMVTTADGKVTTVSRSQVRSIEFKKSDASPGDSPDQRLASLRRAVANQNDIPRILERFKTFIAQNPNTPAAKEAEQDLAVWQDRRDKGLVRAGDQWVSKEQLGQLQAQAAQTAVQVRSLIASSKLSDALTTVDKALAIAPQNASLLYLKGVIYFRQNQIVPARDAFQAAAAAEPGNAPIHNNIAVILWKQHAQMTGLGEYDKAMTAQAEDQTILDNVNEALHGLPKEYKDKDLTKRVMEHFNDQDAALRRTMAAHGQYRWGSQWVDEKEYNRIQAQQKAVQDKIDSMQHEFDTVKATLMKLDRDIVNDEQLMQTIAAQSIQVDPTTGRQYSLPLPQRYYDLQRDIASMQSEKILRQRQLTDLQKTALQQKQMMPQEKFTGVQKAFDVNTTPDLPPPASPSASAASPPASTPTNATAPVPPAPATAPTSVGAPPATTPQGGGVDFGPSHPPAPHGLP
ncbi:MAG TPA: tetratricopeptide repeat protein [Tepidisphaeraceae bacterium]